MSLPVAVLAGGLATRLRPLTERLPKSLPKSLMDVAGKPFIVHQLELLRRNGVTHLVLCLGHLGEQVQAELGNGSRWGMRIDYVFDGPVLLGTGGALRRALPWLGEAFFVLYGDSYLECDYAAVEQAFRAGGKLGLMTVFRNASVGSGNVVFVGDAFSDMTRTPAEMNHIDYGLGILQTSMLNAIRLIRPSTGDGYQDLLGESTPGTVTHRFTKSVRQPVWRNA